MLDNFGQQFRLLVDEGFIFTLDHDTNQGFGTGGTQQHTSFSIQACFRGPDGGLNRLIVIDIEMTDQWYVNHMLRILCHTLFQLVQADILLHHGGQHLQG